MQSISENVPLEKPGTLISVVIPVYNGIPFILETIESVRRQTDTHWELLICDNASRDETATAVRQHLDAKPDTRIRLIIDTELLPMAGNWNRALTYASGNFIKILPADDILKPQCLEIQRSLLEKYPEVGFVTSSKEIIDAKGRILFSRKPLPEGLYNWRSVGLRSLKAVSNMLGEPGGILFRKELLKKCGNYDAGLKYFVDLELLWRFLKISDVYVSEKALYQFRVHGSSASSSSRNPALDEYEQILDRYGDELGFAEKPYLKQYLKMKSRFVVFLRDMVFRISRKFV